MKDPYPSREEILETRGALDEIRAYLGGSIDFNAIQQYLQLPSPVTLAKIAAQLGSCGTPWSNLRDLIVSAAELYQEAEIHTEHQRRNLLSTMNRATLIELATRLNIYDFDDESRAADIDDWFFLSMHSILYGYSSTQRPVIARLGDMDAKATAVADGCLTSKNPATFLKIADSRTTLPRPSLGSELADALRWAVNEPRTNKKNLRAALGDCVRFSLAKQCAELWPDIEDVMGKNEVQKISLYVKDFEPGITAPDYIMRIADEEILSHWEPFFVTPGKLAWLSREFHDFWKRHWERYSKQRTSKTAEVLHDKRKRAGKNGVVRRENSKYLIHSQKFVGFLGAKQIPKDRDARQKLLTDFARDHANQRTKSAQTNIADFLETLYVHRSEEPKEVLAQLHQLRLLKFKERPDEEQKRIKAKMDPFEKSLLSRGSAPKSILSGWSFDVTGVDSCLEILRPAFESKGMSPRQK